MSHREPILRMSAVSKSYPTPQGVVPVLHEVDLDVFPGEFVAVTGPSGSGKTTLLNLAALIDAPTAGRILFEGREVSALGEPELVALRKEKIGMVFQSFCLLMQRSVLENVLFRFHYLDTDPAEARAQSEQALARVGLLGLADRPVRLLSGGEMQRVGIARAVAKRPRLLLADEPTGNLDAHAAAAVMECFRALNGEGITVLLATHNRALLSYCNRAVTCAEGAVAETAVG